MNFDVLSEADLEIIGQALHAAAHGPFFPDWKFHTLFGLDRSEVRRIADEWPKSSASAEDVTAAVNNSLNNCSVTLIAKMLFGHSGFRLGRRNSRSSTNACGGATMSAVLLPPSADRATVSGGVPSLLTETGRPSRLANYPNGGR
jgi:hypothetical protein